MFDNAHKDVYKMFERNIVGGPSIVFCRYHEAGVTKIRPHVYGNEAKTCQIQKGFDCNALYLSTFNKPSCTGSYTLRKSENGFRRQPQEKYKMAYYWMSYVAHSRGIYIQHAFNDGEFVVFPYRVVGYHSNEDLVLEFMGCLYIFFIYLTD